MPTTTTTSALESEIARLHGVYALSRDPRLRAELVGHYDAYAVTLARGFSTRREAIDDLIQVARIALIHAVDRFDPARERPFRAYARATILGELKRHIRDHTWRIRPPRRLQEHYLLVVRTVADLTAELGRSPTIPEIATRAGLTDEQVLEATEVAHSAPISLDHPGDDNCCRLDPGHDDPALTGLDDRLLLSDVLARLPEREQRILGLRFEDELTQAQIAQQLGVSQMSISRALARILARLRTHLASADEPTTSQTA